MQIMALLSKIYNAGIKIVQIEILIALFEIQRIDFSEIQKL